MNPPRAKPWWRDAATAAAVIGLGVALVFNTVGVWQQVRGLEEAEQATALTVLNDLNNFASESDRAINATAAPERRCEEVTVGTLSRKDEAQVIGALEYYDYLAFLLATDELPIEGARTYWARDMTDAYALGRTFLDPGFVAESFPYLRTYAREAPRSARPEACPR